MGAFAGLALQAGRPAKPVPAAVLVCDVKHIGDT